jgi:hypothetical protein
MKNKFTITCAKQKQFEPTVPDTRNAPIYAIGDVVKINVDEMIPFEKYPRQWQSQIHYLLRHNNEQATITAIGALNNGYELQISDLKFGVWAWEHEITKEKFIADKRGQFGLF